MSSRRRVGGRRRVSSRRRVGGCRRRRVSGRRRVGGCRRRYIDLDGWCCRSYNTVQGYILDCQVVAGTTRQIHRHLPATGCIHNCSGEQLAVGHHAQDVPWESTPGNDRPATHWVKFKSIQSGRDWCRCRCRCRCRGRCRGQCRGHDNALLSCTSFTAIRQHRVFTDSGTGSWGDRHRSGIGSLRRKR